MIHCRRVLSTQALYSGTLECSASLLFDQTLLVCRESVVVAFPTRLLISVSRERLSGLVELKYTNSWTVSSSVVCDIGGWWVLHHLRLSEADGKPKSPCKHPQSGS